MNQEEYAIWRGCTIKVKIETRKEARKAQRALRRHGSALTIYHCPHCNCYHLGANKRHSQWREEK